MKRAVMLLMFAAAGLLGCNGRGESTITSSYGSSLVSGQVVVTGVSNPSPAGVQVSVRGTGMTTTLGADGTFAFASMPEEAVLDFHRAADGIEASLTLDVLAGMIVHVKATANADGTNTATQVIVQNTHRGGTGS